MVKRDIVVEQNLRYSCRADIVSVYRDLHQVCNTHKNGTFMY